jgi:hypothetical protein
MDTKELLESLTQDELMLIWAATWALFGQRSPLSGLDEAQLDLAPELLEKLDEWKNAKPDRQLDRVLCVA